jgi:hypothetical protein
VPTIAAILPPITDVFASIAPVLPAITKVLDSIPPLDTPRRLRGERFTDR